MAFTWKEHKDIFKGEGVYHLTFAIVGRKPLLGELVPIEQSRTYVENVKRSISINETQNNTYISKVATVEPSPFGYAVSRDIQRLSDRVDGLTVCAKQIMPDHMHIVVWVKKDSGKSIRQIGNGFRIGIKRIAIEMGIWKETDGHILDIPFIRTLSRRNQLSAMINYVHANPDNAWMRRQHPDLYTIRRRVEHGGLLFDTMGKRRLLDWPDKQVIALSRSLSDEQIQTEVTKALWNAERGVVTLTAAINAGEKTVARAVREAGFPLVVMMLDGFPAEGTDAARYYHPNGVYHTICGEGRLYLMAPHPSNYENSNLIAATEAELQRKASEKGLRYSPIPHDSKRWRMIAGNVMLRGL